MASETVSLANSVATHLTSGDYTSAARLLGKAFDEMAPDSYRDLVDVELTRAVKVGDAAAWSSVAEAIDEPVALYNLATVLWSGTGLEDQALEAMRVALDADAPEAGIALTEWLEWLGRPSEAIVTIREYIDRHGAGPRATGLMGRLALSLEPIPSSETVEQLASASAVDPEFLPSYWDALVASGKYQAARTSLEWAADAGNADAALRLGNLLASELNDKSAAELAYLRAVELGDGHAAHNLAIDLIAAGRLDEAHRYLQIALDRGDFDARDSLGALE